MSWSVYMVLTRRGTLYTGIATDVERRYREHLAGGARAARYLRAHPPAALVFSQVVGDRALASRVEARLKRLDRRAKEAIVARGGLEFDPVSGVIACPAAPRRG